MIDEISYQVYWKSLDSHNEKYVKKIQSDVSKTFFDLQTEILSNNNLEKAIDSLLILQKGIEAESGFKLFDIKRWTQILVNNTKTNTRALIEAVMKRAGREIKTNVEPTEYEKQIAESFKKNNKNHAESIKTIDRDLKKEVERIVEQNPLATKDELKELFKEKLQYKFKEVFTESRSNLIAQTSSTYTSGQGQKIVWNDNGYDLTWLTQRDGDVRDSHVEMDGKRPDENGWFNVNGDVMQSPGGGSDPAENCNCRCVGFPKKRAN